MVGFAEEEYPFGLGGDVVPSLNHSRNTRLDEWNGLFSQLHFSMGLTNHCLLA